MKKINLTISLLFITLFWWTLVFFTISWDLPGTHTPETDGITSKLNLSAREMMREDTYKYPPLQYLIADAFTANIPENILSQNELEQKRTQRIIAYRTISAVMELGIAFFLFLAGIYLLKCPLLYSMGATVFFLLLSPALFYSQSSNMDMPVCFWFAGSIFFAALAECKYKDKEKKKIYFAIQLLAGFFIGCAFCTKDQIYALYILPAIFFFYLKWKESKSLLQAFIPFFIWGTAFTAAVVIIYSLISWEVFLPHFHWISGEGSSPYAVTGKNLFDRVSLIWYSFRDLCKATDLPLLILFFVSSFIVYKNKEKYKTDICFIYTAAFYFLLLLSQFLFFCQIVRYSQIRYFLPVLPFLILLLLYIFCRETEKNRYKKYLISLVLILFIFQCGIAVNFLCILNNSPLARLKKELETSAIYKTYRINTAMAQIGARYLQQRDGTTSKFTCIRPWGAFLGLQKYGIKDIFPDDLSLFLLDPQIIISNKANLFQNNSFYVMQKKYEKLPQIFFSLYEHTNKENYFLYCKAVPEKADPRNSFKKNSLEIQIIKLNYILSLYSDFSFSEMNLIGKSLAAFTPPDSKTYLINTYMYRVLFDAYTAAGRKDDAAKCRQYYISIK